MKRIDFSVKIGKVIFPNPVLTASGTFGYGDQWASFFDVNRLGGIVTKTITLLPRKGNPPPRMIETASGVLNAIGLENPGIEIFLKEKIPFLKTLSIPVIVSIAGACKEEYQELARMLSHSTCIAGIELNVSCPNVKQGGIQFGQDRRLLRSVTSSVRSVTSQLLIVKLSPGVTDIAEMACEAQDAGADAVSLVNTFVGMAVDIKTRRPVLANTTGGLSGPAIKPLALRMVWEVYKKINIPVIGMGGIMNAHDAVEFMLSGAALVSVGTAHFVNPLAGIEIVDGIRTYMQKYHFKNCAEVTGKLVRSY